VETSRLEAAHRHSTWHRIELEASDRCGCYHCLEVFTVDQVRKWIDNHDTAMCPYCGIDAVIGSAAGFPLTRPFLREMRRHWFSARAGPSRWAVLRHALRGPRHLRSWRRYQALLARAGVDTGYHREAVLASLDCGCYWCMSIFPPAAITEWTDQDSKGVGQTAVCPRCGHCGVLGSADGYPITIKFLGDVRKPWF